MPKSSGISVTLQGGLGNQLFCYSAGYYVASNNKLNLECQMTPHYNSFSRDITILSKLKLPGEFIEVSKSPFHRRISLFGILKRVNKKYFSLLNLKSNYFYISKTVGYDPELDLINRPKHLHGYFQTWRYPVTARNAIKMAFEREILLCNYAKELVDQMKSKRILVVHIRLGDYKNPENSYIGVLSPTYYQNIFKREEVQKYKIFVFSDELSRAKKEYQENFPEDTIWVDESNILNPLETLKVMSHGKAFVIANSTFSWWSAFLSESPELIIAPTKWFKEKNDPEYLIPQCWSREVSQWAN